MKVKNFMCSSLVVFDINSSLNELANTMKKYDIGFVPIANKNKIVGVLTDRDIVTRILANNDNKIDGYLTTELITIDSNDEISKAINLMTKHKIKRLLVVENNKLVDYEIISHNETKEKYSLIEKNDYINKIKTNYNNLDDVDTVSSATITSKALKDLIKNVMEVQK